MSETTARANQFRIVFDGALVAAILIQIGVGIYWAGQMNQQMADTRARVSALERRKPRATSRSPTSACGSAGWNRAFGYRAEGWGAMSAENWGACGDFTLGEEGGLCNTPGDPGGLTNFGISQRAYPDVDIANLTRDGALEIYHRDYFTRCRCDDARMHAGVDLMVFDEAANAGDDRSERILQRCLGVEVDGIVGDQTLDAVACADAARLIAAIGAAQLAFYQSLPGWAEFGRDWGGRVARRQTAAMAMIQTGVGA